MIVWINGAFGAGKTQVAHELRRRLGRGWVSDPEFPGYGLHAMLPPRVRGDFQDFESWRAGVRELLARADDVSDPVLVPMTLTDPGRFTEIVGGLRSDGRDVRHFALQASPETLRARLERRSLGVRVLGVRIFGGSERWARDRIDDCVAALAGPEFAEHVPTDDRNIDEVVEDIAERLGLPLVVPRDPPVRGGLRRWRVQLGHLRFF